MLADVLSRAPLKDADPEILDEEIAAQIHVVYNNNEAPAKSPGEIKRSTPDDYMLPKLDERIQNGWPCRRDKGAMNCSSIGHTEILSVILTSDG